jgi:hypothetical protein
MSRQHREVVEGRCSSFGFDSLCFSRVPTDVMLCELFAFWRRVDDGFMTDKVEGLDHPDPACDDRKVSP